MFRLGYACAWAEDRVATWSHVPWNLYGALCGISALEVVDLPAVLSPLTRMVLRYGTLRRHHGRWVSQWRVDPATFAMFDLSLRRRIRNAVPCDAVLAIGDVGLVHPHTFIYQDASMAHIMEEMGPGGVAASQFATYTRSRLLRRMRQQEGRYRRTYGIITMSEWDAIFIRKSGVIPSDRVFVVPPAINSHVSLPRTMRSGNNQARTLLFVGKDFERKGGRLVVEAFVHARKNATIPLRLIVAGPSTWPLPGPIPDGIIFAGKVLPDVVGMLMNQADVFIMPSTFEAFGIVFVEALSAGLPVIARNAYAMPEIIRNGDNGVLIDHHDAYRLADTMITVCMDDEMKRRAEEQAMSVQSHYSWSNVACAIHSIMTTCLAS